MGNAAGGRLAHLVQLSRDAGIVVRRNRIILFVTMALCVLAGIIYILLSTPDYRATASVEVEDVPAGAAGATPRPDVAADGEAIMQTQMEVLRSRAIAEDVARDLSLVGSDRFFEDMGSRRPGQGVGTLSQRQVEADKVVKLLREGLTVELPGKSRVMRISFISADPVLSARVANSYADSLIRADLKRGFESGVQARRFLLGELDGARRDLERAERDLASYAAHVGASAIVGDEGKPSGASGGSVAARLEQLNGFRAQATADRIAAQKRWESARAAGTDSLPEILGNGAMQQLIAQRAQARAEMAEER